MAKAKSNFAVIRGGRNSGPPATQTEIAAIEFTPLNAGTTKAERTEACRKASHAIHEALIFSVEIGVLDKDDLVQKVRNEYEAFGSALLFFIKVLDDVRAVQEMIMAAETRLAVALAIVEPDEGI